MHTHMYEILFLIAKPQTRLHLFSVQVSPALTYVSMQGVKAMIHIVPSDN